MPDLLPCEPPSISEELEALIRQTKVDIAKVFAGHDRVRASLKNTRANQDEARNE